jgi:hypothetical protein
VKDKERMTFTTWVIDTALKTMAIIFWMPITLTVRALLERLWEIM